LPTENVIFMLLAIPTVAKSSGSEKSDFRVFHPLSKELVLAPQVPTSFFLVIFWILPTIVL
jgi:hypothetical protein